MGRHKKRQHQQTAPFESDSDSDVPLSKLQVKYTHKIFSKMGSLNVQLR